jgi:hypothetical protein
MTDIAELIERTRSPFALTERDANEIADALEAQAKEIRIYQQTELTYITRVADVQRECSEMEAKLKARIAELEAAWADSEYFTEIEKENVELKVYIAELEAALWPFAFAAENLEKGSTIEIAASHLRNARETIRT